MSVPQSHIDESQKLAADGIVSLYEIHLNPSGVLRLTLDNTKVWQGHTYEGIGIQMGDVTRSTGEEQNRPTLAVMNYDGIFSSFVAQGAFDKAYCYKYEVLSEHIENDINIFKRSFWIISQPKSVNKGLLQFELRTPADGPFYLVPARMFIPPEFPSVSLG